MLAALPVMFVIALTVFVLSHMLPGDPDPHIVECPLDPHPLPLSYRHEEGTHFYDGDYHNRRRTAGADVDVCFNGRIAVTKIRLL